MTDNPQRRAAPHRYRRVDVHAVPSRRLGAAAPVRPRVHGHLADVGARAARARASPRRPRAHTPRARGRRAARRRRSVTRSSSTHSSRRWTRRASRRRMSSATRSAAGSALELAVRGRARSVVALAPAGGWADDAFAGGLFDAQATLYEQLEAVLRRSTRSSRRPRAGTWRRSDRRAPRASPARPDRPPHPRSRGMQRCGPCSTLPAGADWGVDGDAIACPVRIVWGAADRVLPWPAPLRASASSFRTPTGSSSTASVTAHSSTCRWRRPSSCAASRRAKFSRRGRPGGRPQAAPGAPGPAWRRRTPRRRRPRPCRPG